MAIPTTLPATFVAGNVLTAAQMNDLRGAFRILQVVQATKTDAVTVSCGQTKTDLTGFTASITPSATSSKVLVICSPGLTGNTVIGMSLFRDSTELLIGDAAGSRIRISFGSQPNQQYGIAQSFSYLDSPATTSAITYKLQVVGDQGASVAYLNRGYTDTNGTNFFRNASTWILMEVSA